MGINGLHNVYNVTGVIIAAHEFLGLPYDRILPSVESFTGVSGRMEEVGNVGGRDIYVDYAHNPAGVETLLKEFKKLFGDFTCVITVSSESGYKGDVEIFDSAVRFSKFIVPASEASRKIAAQMLHENPELDDRIFMGQGSDFEKTGTLGASEDEVRDGIKKALDCDCDVVIAVGEAATRYKSVVFDL